MQTISTRRVRSSASGSRAIDHGSSAISGRHARSVALAHAPEDFTEPHADLVLGEPIDPREFAQAQRALKDQAQAIRALEERVHALQADKARLVETLSRRDAEIAELNALFLPVPADGDAKPTRATTEPAAAPQGESVEPTAGTTEPSVKLAKLTITLDEERAFEAEFLDETYFYAGIEQELEQGGVFIATYRPLPLELDVALAFELDDGTKLSVRGRVSWRSSASRGGRPGAGIAFADMPEADRTALTKLGRERGIRYVEF